MATPKHYIDAFGRYVGSFTGTSPPAGSIEVSAAPADSRQVYSSGSWQPMPGPTYRELRRAAYEQQLGKDPGNTINTLGDVLDTLITELVARGASITPGFADLVTKVVAIKTANPAPPS